MLHEEFEHIAGYQVTYETYKNIVEPMYLAVDLPKAEFVKLLNRKALEYIPEHKSNIKKMLVRDRAGYTKTPNGCWYNIEYVDLVDVDIASGKYIVAPITEEDRKKLVESGADLNYSCEYDFDYTMCLNTKKKPIELTWMF